MFMFYYLLKHVFSSYDEFFHVKFSFPSCNLFKVRALVWALKLDVQHFSNKGESGGNLEGSEWEAKRWKWGRGWFLACCLKLSFFKLKFYFFF